MGEGTSAIRLPTGVRPDAVTDTEILLIKACRTLRLTHQIRLATFMAHSQGKRMVLRVWSGCVLSADLEAFISETGLIEVRRG